MRGLRQLVTAHPSSLLRVQDEADKRADQMGFVEDLRAVSTLTAEAAGRAPRAAAQ
jgi:hypothetical protein